MPAKGKHRRPKSQRLTRSMAAAGTGGAALALPLLGAAGAHAAPAQSAADSVASTPNAADQAPESAPVAVQVKAEESGTGKVTTRTYAVRSGDSLSKIADTQDVGGGWQRLYSDNRASVGADPSLIHPGLKLTLGGKAAAAPGSGSGTSGADRADRSAEKKSTSSRQSTPSRKTAPSEQSTGGRQSTGNNRSTGSQQSTESRKTATAPKPATPSTATGFASPVASPTVGTPYRMSGSMWSSGYHTGVDFVVPTGTSLRSVGAGTVVSAGWGGAYGNQVVVRLADGHYAQYAHLSSLSVIAGQTVTGGQQVGLSGATGNVTGPHLHFEIRTGAGYGSDVDPLAYLRAKGVSL
ncbi:M23 family metallopeptidase [Streptomyces beigongshangae]|uniref:M23 family metallopeptidase n=1 Tax=Streptomyces beigongshangae TaxID=2841597 RepID=UPI001C85BE7E|nr:M23 family metallopeptidase [Streptomyces sp. REN17]